VRSTEALTFAALRKAGLVHVNDPERSHLLELISKSRPNTPLLTQTARNEELSAFRSWLVAASKNKALLAIKNNDSVEAGPLRPLEVIRHSRIDRVLASFEKHIWTQQGRCMGCHTPGTPDNKRHTAQYGERVQWFVPGSAELTLQRLLKQKLINIVTPSESLLLLKPLNKVPHGGGVKFVYGDAGYKEFRRFIEDYAACVKDGYRSASGLPKEDGQSLIYTDCILTIEGAPKAWGGKLVRIDAYQWDNSAKTWASKPVATGDRGLDATSLSTNIWMWMKVPSGSNEERALRQSARLPAGKYKLVYYVDVDIKLDKDFQLPTDSPEFRRGEQIVETDWRTGFGSRTIVKVDMARR
jgi:hypothetical protein